LLASLSTSQKKENETMEELKKKCNDLVKHLPTTIKPPPALILIHHMEYFEGEIRYQLRDKDPQTLVEAQNYVVRIEKNKQDARRPNLLGFSRGISNKPIEDKNKKIENQGSYSDGMKDHSVN